MGMVDHHVQIVHMSITIRKHTLKQITNYKSKFSYNLYLYYNIPILEMPQENTMLITH